MDQLKGFDLLEEVNLEDPVTGQTRKAYRLQYGNLAKAWNFVEAHLRVAIENYAKTVEYLSQIIKQDPQSITAPITRATTA